MENHHFSWENPLFLWPFSIAMLVHHRDYTNFNHHSSQCRPTWVGENGEAAAQTLHGGTDHLVWRSVMWGLARWGGKPPSKNMGKTWETCGKNMGKNMGKMWKKCGKSLIKKTMEIGMGRTVPNIWIHLGACNPSTFHQQVFGDFMGISWNHDHM